MHPLVPKLVPTGNFQSIPKLHNPPTRPPADQTPIPNSLQPVASDRTTGKPRLLYAYTEQRRPTHEHRRRHLPVARLPDAAGNVQAPVRHHPDLQFVDEHG